MITFRFKGNTPMEAKLTPAAVLGYAGGLIEAAADENRLPLTLRLPGDTKWSLPINTSLEALGLAKLLVDAVKDAEVARYRADHVAQEQRRLAGASPIGEEVEFVTDGEGVPVAARKAFRY